MSTDLNLWIQTTEGNFVRLEDHTTNMIRDVLCFHMQAGQPAPASPLVPSHDELELRRDLHKEEVTKELDDALESLKEVTTQWEAIEALAAVADGIVDGIYVLLGTGVQLGIPLAEVWRRVHAANMAKIKDGVHRRSDGKILKPPGWVPPDVIGAICKALVVTDGRVPIAQPGMRTE